VDRSRSVVSSPKHDQPICIRLLIDTSRPDNCDGTYEASCDSTRAYTNITDILQAQGRDDLLTYMNEYWIDIDGDNESFWAHEWGKHGTCINTIDPDCYEGYTAQEEVGDYFEKVVDLFKGLDTYKVRETSAGV
jgi:ribonuclease T2